MTAPAGTKLPLWRVMQRAESRHQCSGNWHLGFAAELHAIAGAVTDKFDLGTPETFVSLEALTSWLRDEAAKAERGDD